MEDVGEYRLLHKIGVGSFATVWKAMHKITGEIVAIKVIVPRKDQLRQQLELIAQEQAIMKSIAHPNVVKLLGMISEDEHDELSTRYLVMEFCEGGDLDHYIHLNKKLSAGVARTIMLQLAAALQELRRMNLIHRDLKPHNLLLKNKVAPGSDPEGEAIVVKLTDFGLARKLQPQGMAQTMCGTYLYMAPEVISHNKYDAKADLWSVGVMLYQMITGRRPFEACSSEDLFRKLGNKVQFRGEDSWDPDCRDLCEGLLRKNPLERISFEEFFNHKFLRGSSKAALVCDHEKADSVAILHRAPRPLETIPGDRQRPVRGRNPLMDSIEERIAREYVMVSSPSSSKNKHPHCPIPKPAPPPPRAHPPSKNSSKEDLERSETLRICAKLLGEVARFKLQDSKKLESLSLCLAALGSLKRALSIATTPQLLEDFSAALDETEAVAANLDRSSDQALPDAAEIIYQAALAAGRAGAVDEILEKRGRASVEYAKASTLLFFLIMDDSPIHLHSLDVASAHHCFHAITVRHKQCKNASH